MCDHYCSHTSWVDYPLGLLVRKVLDVEVHYIGKKSLFRPPFGWFFRWMNGTPVDHSKIGDTVSAITRLFHDRDTFRLALSPEAPSRPGCLSCWWHSTMAGIG